MDAVLEILDQPEVFCLMTVIFVPSSARQGLIIAETDDCIFEESLGSVRGTLCI